MSFISQPIELNWNTFQSCEVFWFCLALMGFKQCLAFQTKKWDLIHSLKVLNLCVFRDDGTFLENMYGDITARLSIGNHSLLISFPFLAPSLLRSTIDSRSIRWFPPSFSKRAHFVRLGCWQELSAYGTLS